MGDDQSSFLNGAVEDFWPDLGVLLADIEEESERCLKYAATLSRWSVFWKITLVLVGALVAAQGGALKAWGASTWLTGSFVVLGVIMAVGSSYQAFFNPGERSPKFAEFGLEYMRLAYETKQEAATVARAASRTQPIDVSALQELLASIVQNCFGELATLRRSEIELYVTGPVSVGRRSSKPVRARS
jgi:hypothetical protein